jgi:hypothetical protein
MLLPTLQQETEYVDIRPNHREPASFYEKWVDQCPCSLATLVPLSGANLHYSLCKACHPRASCVSLHGCSMDDIHQATDSVFLSQRERPTEFLPKVFSRRLGRPQAQQPPHPARYHDPSFRSKFTTALERRISTSAQRDRGKGGRVACRRRTLLHFQAHLECKPSSSIRRT